MHCEFKKDGERLAQTWSQSTIQSREHSTACLPSSHSRRWAPERSSANYAGSRLVKTLSIALGQFRKRLSLAATGGEHIEHRFD